MPMEPPSLRPTVSTKSRTGLRFREGEEDPVPHESALAQGVSSARLVWTRTLKLFSILHQGILGSLRIIARGSRVFWESQSSAGLDYHHELVIYCFNFTMRSLTGAGSVLRTLQILACVLLSLMVVRFQMFKLEINNLFRQNTYLQNKKHMLTCQRWDWLL